MQAVVIKVEGRITGEFDRVQKGQTEPKRTSVARRHDRMTMDKPDAQIAMLHDL